jgi:histone acetyltransferase 1
MSSGMMDDDDNLAQEIEQQVNEWSSNSNECLNIQLVRGDGSVAVSCHPEFTYAMFGEEEAIFGYQDLSINLSFRAHDLQPKLKVTYGKIFPVQGEVRPTDIPKALSDFLPESAFDNQELDDEADFRPPGEKIHEYKRGGKTYEVWCASLADPAAKKLLENMQILVPFFIDGGSVLELEQDWTTQRWKIFLVYEIDGQASGSNSPYTLAGYGTSYRSFTFPERQKAVQWDVFSPSSQSLMEILPTEVDTNKLAPISDFKSPLDLPSRERLSQFLMLPPFHGAGHGQELYKVMYKHLATPDNVREFTIEDPNETFDDLRDLCDLLYLRANVPEFAALRIQTDIPAEKMASSASIPTDLIVPIEQRKAIMSKTKLMPRQFDRLVEMHTLSFIPANNRSRNRITRKEKTTNEHDRQYFFWRLYAKQRLYIFNRDQLAQVEHAERVEKLEAALDSVLEAYSEMIERVQAKEEAIANGQIEGDAAPSNSGATKRKRKVVEEDEDEDGEAGAEQAEEDPSTNGHKKAKAA